MNILCLILGLIIGFVIGCICGVKAERRRVEKILDKIESERKFLK